jgi:single-stranded DNA-binding protein
MVIMSGFSNVQLLGRVGKDPMQVGSEMRKVVFFEVAVNHVVRTKQEIDSERKLYHYSHWSYPIYY